MYLRRKREQRTHSEATATRHPVSAGPRAAMQASGATLEHGALEVTGTDGGPPFPEQRLGSDAQDATFVASG
jgi:hypothetical protein